MYITSNEYKKANLQPYRQFESRITIGNRIITNEEVVSVNLQQSIQQEATFTIGNTISSSLNLTFLHNDIETSDREIINLEIGLLANSDYEYIPLGIYNIDLCNSNDTTTNITAYDNMVKFDISYEENNSQPTVHSVINRLVELTGIEFAGALSDCNNYNLVSLSGYSCREVLGFVAGTLGCNATIDRQGKFKFINISKTSSLTITNENYLNYFRQSKLYKISKLVNTLDESTIEIGSINDDTVCLNMANPFVNEEILQDLYNKVNGFSFLPYELNWNGDLSLDLGDSIEILDKKGTSLIQPILNQSFIYTGGLSSIVQAQGDTKLANTYTTKTKEEADLDRVKDDINNVVNKVDVMYYLSTSKTELKGGEWTTNSPTWIEGKYIWSKTVTEYKNGNIIDSEPVCITGAKGDQGLQGIQGEKGEQGIPGTPGTNGKTTYFHIKYSSVSNPTSSSQMTETPSTYIGTYVDYTEADSTDPRKYTWSRFQGLQGEKGEQGIPGTNGSNGRTTYLHIKYSNDGGKTFTSNNGEDVGMYIGTYTDFNINDSSSVSSYTWNKVKGQGIDSVTEEYAINSDKKNAPTTGWSTKCPTWETGKYLWTRSKIIYNNPTETVYTTPYCDSSWEAVNEIEIGDRNLLLNSGTHVPATSAYLIKTYPLSKPSELNKTYTIVIKAKVSTDATKTWIGAYLNSNVAYNSRFIIENKGSFVIYKGTFTVSSDNFVNKNSISIYCGNSDLTGTCEIEWCKLVEGNKTSDIWIPAPEDIYSEIEKVDDRISLIVSDGSTQSNLTITPSAINAIAKDIKLKATNITLEGLVTANSNFKILSNGSIEAKNGKFTGSITGSTIQSTKAVTGGTNKIHIEGAKITSSITSTNDIQSVEIEGNTVTLQQTYTVGTNKGTKTILDYTGLTVYDEDGSAPAVKLFSHGNVNGGNVGQFNGNVGVTGNLKVSGTITGSLSGNASSATTATTLKTARTINGTSFNGSANITTANWGTARTLTIGKTGKSVNGSANVSWSLAEIGALPLTGGTMTGTLVFSEGQIRLANSTSALQAKDTSGTNRSLAYISASDNSYFGKGLYDAGIGGTIICGNKVTLRSKNEILLQCGGTTSATNTNTIEFTSIDGNGFFRSTVTNATRLGSLNYLWNIVYSKNGVNQTSDRNLKENIRYVDENLPNKSAKTISEESDLTSQDLYNFVKDDLFLAKYNFIGEEEEKIGFIAQDLLYNSDGTENKIGQIIVSAKDSARTNAPLSYNEGNYVNVLAGALKQAILKIEKLEELINGRN